LDRLRQRDDDRRRAHCSRHRAPDRGCAGAGAGLENVMSSTQTKLAPGGRLPDLALPSVSGESTVPLKPGGRRNPVIVVLHGGGCEACRTYLHRLTEVAADLREWDAHVVVIAHHAAEAVVRDLPFRVVADPDGTFAARTGIYGASVVIADQWGE